jgi:hypothetical protein
VNHRAVKAGLVPFVGSEVDPLLDRSLDDDLAFYMGHECRTFTPTERQRVIDRVGCHPEQSTRPCT